MNRQYAVMSTGKGAATAGAVLIVDKINVLANHENYKVPICLVGPTSARPKAGDPDIVTQDGALQSGVMYLDTTLQYIIVSGPNGLWYNPYSGAAV